jgi:hypothetical protein
MVYKGHVVVDQAGAYRVLSHFLVGVADDIE